MSSNVLIIEDDPDVVDLVSLHLKDLDCEVIAAEDGIDGLAKARAGYYNLIILDLMLPGLGGLELCQRLRDEADNAPFLMLTAKTSEADRVLGLEIGTDVYLTKPFSIEELVARVKAIFRRNEVFSKGQQHKQSQIIAGDLVIDLRRRKVTVANPAEPEYVLTVWGVGYKFNDRLAG